MKITKNKEDYLKAIYELGGKDNKISNKKITEALKVSAPSVSEMINKLLQDGYIEHIPYKGVILTPLGLKQAIEIKKRHLLWEVFLVEKLGYHWEDVHDEAEKLEHVTSPELEKLLDKYLNYPKFCPHGNPIIREEDEEKSYISMKDLSKGEKAVIKRLRDNKEVLRYIEEVNLKIGDQIELVDKDNKRMRIKIRGKEIEIELGFVKDIYVYKDIVS